MSIEPIPVIAYHRILKTSEVQNGAIHSPYAMLQSDFAQQMWYLAENGFQAVTLDEVLSNPESREKRVIITFDDGYVDNYTNALPVLNEFSLKATFFVIVNRIGTQQFMTWEHLQNMLDVKMAVQSHTLNHSSLPNLSRADLFNELLNSRMLLEERLGQRVQFISFPHGMYNSKVLQACRQASYKGCFNSDFGYLNPNLASYRINRIMVKRGYDFDTFVHMLAGDWQFALRFGLSLRLKRKLNRFIGFKGYQGLYRLFYSSAETVT